MKCCKVLATFLFVFNASAQTEDLDAVNKGFSNMTQAGKLFQVKLHPKDNQLHLFVTGVSAANLKVDGATVEASVGTGSAKKTFIAEKTKDPQTGRTYYKMKNPGTKQPLNLKIRSGDSSEDFTFPPPN